MSLWRRVANTALQVGGSFATGVATGGASWAVQGLAQVGAGIGLSELGRVLFSPDQRYVLDPNLSLLLERDIEARYVYGYWPAELTQTFYNSRIVQRDQFHSDWGIDTHTRTATGAEGEEITEVSIFDQTLYASDGELTDFWGLKLDDVFVQMVKPDGAAFYIPDERSVYRGKIFAQTFFSVTEGPTLLQNAYTNTPVRWTNADDHTSDDSYLWVGLVEDKDPFWSERGFPRTIESVGQGVKVYDVTKYPNHIIGTDGRPTPKVFTDNAFAIAYAIERDILRTPDHYIDWNALLRGYQYAERLVNNDFEEIEDTAGHALREGQFAANYYADQPTTSRQYSISGIFFRRPAQDHRVRIETGIGGTSARNGGKFSYFAGRHQQPVGEITNDMWTPEVATTFQPALADQFNVVRVSHISQAKNYRPNEFEIKDYEAIKRDGRELPLAAVIDIPDCPDEPEAYRKANNLLRQNRQFETLSGGITGFIDYNVGDVLTTTNHAWGILQKPYTLIEATYDANSHTTAITLRASRLDDFSNGFELGELRPREFELPFEPLPQAPAAPDNIVTTGAVGGFTFSRPDPISATPDYRSTTIQIRLADPANTTFADGTTEAKTESTSASSQTYGALVDIDSAIGLELSFQDFDSAGRGSPIVTRSVTSIDQKTIALRGYPGFDAWNHEFDYDTNYYQNRYINIANGFVLTTSRPSVEATTAGAWAVRLGRNDLPLLIPGGNPLPDKAATSTEQGYEIIHQIAADRPDVPTGDSPTGWNAGFLPSAAEFGDDWATSNKEWWWTWRVRNTDGTTGAWQNIRRQASWLNAVPTWEMMSSLTQSRIIFAGTDADGDEIYDALGPLDINEYVTFYASETQAIVYQIYAQPRAFRRGGDLPELPVRTIRTQSRLADPISDAALLDTDFNVRFFSQAAVRPTIATRIDYDDYSAPNEQPTDSLTDAGSYRFASDTADLTAGWLSILGAAKVKIAYIDKNDDSHELFLRSLVAGGFYRYEVSARQYIEWRIASVDTTNTGYVEIDFDGDPIIVQATPPTITNMHGIDVTMGFTQASEGLPAIDRQVIYAVNDSETTPPTLPVSTTAQRENPNYTPAGWTRTIPPFTNTDRNLWRTERTELNPGTGVYSEYLPATLFSRQAEEGQLVEEIWVLLDRDGIQENVRPDNAWGYDYPNSLGATPQVTYQNETYTFSDGEPPFSETHHFRARWWRYADIGTPNGTAVADEWKGPVDYTTDLPANFPTFRQYRLHTSETDPPPIPFMFSSNESARYIYAATALSVTTPPATPTTNTNVPPAGLVVSGVRWLPTDHAAISRIRHAGTQKVWLSHARYDEDTSTWDNWDTPEDLNHEPGFLGFLSYIQFIDQNYALSATYDEVLGLEPPQLIDGNWVNESGLNDLLDRRAEPTPGLYIWETTVQYLVDADGFFGIKSDTDRWWVYSEPRPYPLPITADDLLRIFRTSLQNRILPDRPSDTAQTYELIWAAGANTSPTWDTRAAAPSPEASYGIAFSNIAQTTLTLTASGGPDSGNWQARHRIGEGAWTTLTAQSSAVFSVTGLTASTTYEFEVRRGTGDWSAGQSTTTLATTAPEPAAYSLSFFSVSQTGIHVIVNGGPTSGNYQLRHRASGTTSWTTASAHASAIFRVTGLTAGTTYEFQGRRGTGAWSSSATRATTGTPAYSIAFSNVTQSQIRITGSGGPDSGNWQARRRVSGAGAFSTTTAQAGASFLFTGLTAGTTYEFQIRRGTGNWSSSQTQATSAATQRAIDIVFSSVTETSFTATASGGPASGNWQMRWRTGTGAWTTLSAQVSPAFSITGLTAGTRYEVEARRGASEWSAGHHQTTSTATTDSNYLISITGITATSMNVSALPTGGQTGTWALQYRTGTGAWTNKAADTISSLGAIFDLTGLTKETEYEIRVRRGTGSWSTSTTRTTLA